MSEAVTLKANYPILRAVFVTPTLLEVGVSRDSFDQPLLVKDSKEMAKLKSGRGAKAAKRWAPLFVHNALFSGISLSDQELKFALDESEAILGKCGSNSWFAAFREAGAAGVPPSAWIKKMPAGKKQLLNSQEREWKNAANRVEALLTRWILANLETAEALAPQSEAGYIGAVSLKKLARFKPSA